ncbi:hypothetical protein Fmac_027038 [Flemingia macrophylla]|uniref:Disease resistance protein At4g27190-like leucine-rich repeats domain-containing protein n=1 Tax=Flemingia macrophylla TaxID=520843 RepID=A0ABD1LGM2_9FABA
MDIIFFFTNAKNMLQQKIHKTIDYLMALLDVRCGFVDEEHAEKILTRSIELIDLKEDAFAILELPEINKLLLEGLPNLRCFSLGEIVKWPSLENISVNNCPNLEMFGLGRIKMSKIKPVITKNMEKLDIDTRIAYLFESWEELVIRFVALSKVVFKSLSRLEVFYYHHLEFPNLQTLMIEDCPKLIKFTTGFATTNASDTIDVKSFSELNELQLDNCERLVYVIHSKTLQEFRNLKKLAVSHCKALKMVFHIDGEIAHSLELLQLLNELTLTYLPNLTHIINREISMFGQHLKILQVKQCESLNTLPVSLMLKNIQIHDCKALEKVIIINKKEGTRDNFHQLNDVSLENLTMLFSVFPTTYEFPSLETLKIANCPIMNTFVEESNEVKDFSELATSNCFFPNSKLWLGNLKKIISYIRDSSGEEPLKEEVQDKGDRML